MRLEGAFGGKGQRSLRPPSTWGAKSLIINALSAHSRESGGAGAQRMWKSGGTKSVIPAAGDGWHARREQALAAGPFQRGAEFQGLTSTRFLRPLIRMPEDGGTTGLPFR